MIKFIQILAALALAFLVYKVAVFALKIAFFLALTVLIYFMLRSKFNKTKGT